MRVLILALFVAQTAFAARFPALSGKDLHGVSQALPEALSGTVSILVVGFSKGSGKACQAWEDRIWADWGANTRVALKTLIELEGAPSFIVPFIVRGIKKGKSAERFGSVLVLRDGRQSLAELAGYAAAAADAAYILLLDKSATVVWKGHGSDLDDYTVLRQKMEPLL